MAAVRVVKNVEVLPYILIFRESTEIEEAM
jgi:hypothetical protein